jgi:hypothetical protein
MNSFDTLLTAYSTLEDAFDKLMQANYASKNALDYKKQALDLNKQVMEIYKKRSEETLNTFNETLQNIQNSNLIIIRDNEINPHEWCKANCKHSFRIYEQYGLPPFALFSDSEDAVMFKLFLG